VVERISVFSVDLFLYFCDAGMPLPPFLPHISMLLKPMLSWLVLILVDLDVLFGCELIHRSFIVVGSSLPCLVCLRALPNFVDPILLIYFQLIDSSSLDPQCSALKVYLCCVDM
jgi:hypothetical protein